MNKIIFIFIFFISQSFASLPEDFKVINDRVPYEFQLLFQTLKNYAQTPKEEMELVGLSQKLDETFSVMEKPLLFQMIKAEIIRSVLENQFKEVKSVSLNKAVIASFEEKTFKDSASLSPLARWIVKGTLADLKALNGTNLIKEQNFDSRMYAGTNLVMARTIEKKWRYLSGWVGLFLYAPPEVFAKETVSVAKRILYQLIDKSKIFDHYSSSLKKDQKTAVFNIPPELTAQTPSVIKENIVKSQTLEEASIEEKHEAKQTTQKLEVDDMSTISDDVQKELEKKVGP